MKIEQHVVTVILALAAVASVATAGYRASFPIAVSHAAPETAFACSATPETVQVDALRFDHQATCH